MVGRSSRFTAAGYTAPKYMLPLGGRPTFDFAVAGFRRFFSDTIFLFIVRDVAGTPAFVVERCRAIGIRRVRCAVLKAPTRGQAETVHLGIDEVGVGAEEPITIFNIDTFRPNFTYPEATADGYLEVFVGSGTNWSFVGPDPTRPGGARRTTEKDPISDLCCTGLYHFGRRVLFDQAYTAELDRFSGSTGELYVAPIYNHLIASGADIRYSVIPSSEVVFCGVPAEYELLLGNAPLLIRLRHELFDLR
jgi:hypothetical protein